jgi:hypothetical protein
MPESFDRPPPIWSTLWIPIAGLLIFASLRPFTGEYTSLWLGVAVVAMVGIAMVRNKVRTGRWTAGPKINISTTDSRLRWHWKRIANGGGLEWLEELAKEHQEGIRDNRKQLEWLIRAIRTNYPSSPALEKRLENVRRILDGGT